MHLHPSFELIPNPLLFCSLYLFCQTNWLSCYASAVVMTLCLCFTVKPKITYIVNQSTSEMEEQVTLTCEASGDPTPTISWSYGGDVFTEGEQVKHVQMCGLLW